MTPIKAIPYKTTISEHFTLTICALCVGFTIGLVICLIFNEIFNPPSITEMTGIQIFICILFGIIIAFFGIYLFISKGKEKSYWELNDNFLIRGNKNKIKFNLEDIEKLIVGIPQWSGLFGKLNAAGNPDIAAKQRSWFQSAFVIKFTNNTFIPLNIHMNQNGTELMNALVEKLKNKIDENYEFSKKEKRLLYRPRWNILTRL